METIYLTRAMMPDFEEYQNEISDMWETHWVTSFGPKQTKLENELCEYLDCKHVITFASGHIALEAVIEAMELKGEIITTPYTFVSTTHAIVRKGIMPVFCDIKDDYTIDESEIERLISNRTSAILPVHTYGNVCAVEQIEEIAQKYKLRVIYDSAHAFGVKYKDKSIASFGDAGVFSFHASKVFNTIEGGAVVCNDDLLAERLKKIRYFGIASEIDVEVLGTNGKMNEFEAAMGLCNLKKINIEIDIRRKWYERYVDKLGDICDISFQKIDNKSGYNYIYFPIRFKEESMCNIMYEHMRKNNITACRHFYPITSKFSCYKGLNLIKTPNADNISRKVLLLPLHSGLTDISHDYIVDIFRQGVNLFYT